MPTPMSLIFLTFEAAPMVTNPTCFCLPIASTPSHAGLLPAPDEICLKLTVHAQGRVHRLLARNRVRSLACILHRGSIDLKQQIPDELEVDDGLSHGGDLVFGVGLKVVAEKLAFGSVSGVLQDHGQLQGLHEEIGADDVVIVERAPA